MRSPETTIDQAWQVEKRPERRHPRYLLDVRFILTSPFYKETSYVANGSVVAESVAFSEASCMVAEYLASSVLL